LIKSYKYRLYPTKQQIILLDKHFGCCRLVYNLALETKINAYQSNRTYIYKYDLVKQITDLKKDCPWLYEICNQSLQQTIFNLDTAFKNFFRNKKHFGFPKFKNKKSKQSFKIMSDIKIDFENKKYLS
jgi:putative transposase